MRLLIPRPTQASRFVQSNRWNDLLELTSPRDHRTPTAEGEALAYTPTYPLTASRRSGNRAPVRSYQLLAHPTVPRPASRPLRYHGERCGAPIEITVCAAVNVTCVQ